MDSKNRFAVVKALARFHNRLTSISCRQYGSLYYTVGLGNSCARNDPVFNQEGNELESSQFAIRPFVTRDFLGNGRATLELNREPGTQARNTNERSDTENFTTSYGSLSCSDRQYASAVWASLYPRSQRNSPL